MLVVGESVVDRVRAADGTTVEYAGGSGANVAVALARLGRPVRFASAWADDARGAVLAGRLAGAGVELAADPHTVERTATATASIGPDGGASYAFDLAWRLGRVPLEPAPSVVHACSIGAVLEPGADQVRTLIARLREVAIVSYDINARPAITGTGADVVASTERLAALSDVVKASDEDLAHLYPDLDVPVAARRLLALGPAAVLVTKGGRGATWYDSNLEVHLASVPVEVADTIGAGDTFAAAIIDGLWDLGMVGADRRDALRALGREVAEEVLGHAIRAAAVTVSRPGADPPHRAELSGSC